MGTHLIQPYVALARVDAQTLGVADGQTVQVAAGGRQVALPARVDGRVPQGVVAIPRNLAGQPAERLLGDEQVSGEVEVVTGR
jgi:anaerobic selenocysteine-containing dehydrogenase